MKLFVALALSAVSAVAGFSTTPRTVPFSLSLQAGMNEKVRSRQTPLVVLHSSSSPNEEPTCWNPRLRSVMGSIATAGSLETAYLTFTKLAGTTPSLCTNGGDCSSVLNGPYSFIPGTHIPLATAGFLAYASVAVLALLPLGHDEKVDEESNRVALTALTTAMGVFSVFLMSILFGVLKEICVFCIASAVFSISLATLAWLGGCLPKQRVKDGITLSAGGGVMSFLVAVLLFANIDSPATAYGDDIAGPPGTPTTLLAKGGEAPPSITTDSSAQALALASDMEKLNTRFFGAFWCSHCFDQKQAMGKQAMAKIPYVECSRDGLDSQADMCKEAKVPGYPTWEINGKLYPGEQSLEELEVAVKEARGRV